MMHKKKNALSLLELMLVIAIGSILLAGLKIFQNKKEPSLETRLQALSEIFQKAYAQAILMKKYVQVRLFFGDDRRLEAIAYAPCATIDEMASQKFLEKTSIKPALSLNKLIINGKDELASQKTKESWIVIYPQGYTQECIFHISALGQKYVYTLNPFNAVLEAKDEL